MGYAPCYAWVMLLVPGLRARGASESRRFQMTVSAAWGGEGSTHYRDVGQPQTQGRLVKGSLKFRDFKGKWEAHTKQKGGGKHTPPPPPKKE